MRRRIAIVALVVNIAMLIAAGVVWLAAAMFGWLESVAFVSHVSMLALVFAAVSGIPAGLAALFAEEASEVS